MRKNFTYKKGGKTEEFVSIQLNLGAKIDTATKKKIKELTVPDGYDVRFINSGYSISVSGAEYAKANKLMTQIKSFNDEFAKGGSVKDIASNYDPKATTYKGNSKKGYSVLVKDKNSDFTTWVDVWIEDNDVRTEWNQYIFHHTDPKDVRQQKLQENDDIFDYATSEAVEHLKEQKKIYDTDRGWYNNDDLTIYAKGGKVLSEDELWDMIESYKWDGSKYRDYERIGKKVSKLSKDKYKQVYGFARAKQRLLRKKFDKVWLSDDFPYTGDDSWTDLRAEIVGRGKKFYNNMNSKKLREMAENQDYNENFLYSFHHHKGFNDFGSSDDLMDYVEKWYAKGGKTKSLSDFNKQQQAQRALYGVINAMTIAEAKPHAKKVAKIMKKDTAEKFLDTTSSFSQEKLYKSAKRIADGGATDRQLLNLKREAADYMGRNQMFAKGGEVIVYIINKDGEYVNHFDNEDEAVSYADGEWGSDDKEWSVELWNKTTGEERKIWSGGGYEDGREWHKKGGEVKKKGTEMIMGGLAGVLLGIFLNK